METELRSHLDILKDQPGNTIRVLQRIQDHYSYLPEEILDEVSRRYHIPLSDLYSVATFYSQFKFNKPGELQIKVCHGTACHINGAEILSDTLRDVLDVKTGETTPDGKFSLEDVACLGCCSLAPVIMINERVFGNLDDKKVKRIIKDYMA
jgi:NADH-quinone oxidoreductase subunit E